MKSFLSGAVFAAVILACVWFDHRTEYARHLRATNAVTAEQVAREGMTDREFYARNPKHFPTEATSTHKKD
ncbi:hypothetical protein [Bradyrhizobium sp. 153]|uniref:hypothetical protein n=1 Tax=Bradyrhizobium sp. 153 TaxID=2782627 RepID=UPI001FF801E6|nr:hypothetical protein [Bradyrhizobium sp. 153]MCK1668670.1 hypothetical protein [Bradyrhizobium sp. 153]